MRSFKGKKGAALLLVIMLVSLVALATVEFQRVTRYELTAGANMRDALVAHALVRSGVAGAEAFLLTDLADNGFDHPGEDWGRDDLIFPLEQGTVSFSVTDNSGKFPLWALVNNGIRDPTMVNAFARLLDMVVSQGASPADLADAVADWMDDDTTGNWESSDYTVPNSVIEHLDELGRVPGFAELGEELDDVIDLLDTRSEKSVNVNSAPAPVLYALQPNFSFEEAEEAREIFLDAPAEKNSDVNNSSIYPLFAANKADRTLTPAVTSTRFLVEVRADVGGAARLGRTLLERNNTNSTVKTVSWVED